MQKEILSQKSFSPKNQVPPTTTEGCPISNSPSPVLSAAGTGTRPHRGKMIKYRVSFADTCRKLHLLEALDGWRDPISLHQDVVLLPDALVSLFRHAQDITWGCPTVDRQQAGEVNTVQYSGAAPSPVPTDGHRQYHCQSHPHLVTG